MKNGSVAQGALLTGKSHKQGGIDVVNAAGQKVNAQGGEIVINAEASAKHCEKLSEINQSAGNGAPLPCDQIPNAVTDTPLNNGGTIPAHFTLQKQFGSFYIYRDDARVLKCNSIEQAQNHVHTLNNLDDAAATAEIERIKNANIPGMGFISHDWGNVFLNMIFGTLAI